MPDLFAYRRNLHPLRTGASQRPLGMVHLGTRLGHCCSRHQREDPLPGPIAGGFHRALPGAGLADSGGGSPHHQQHTGRRNSLAAIGGASLQRRDHPSHVDQTALQSRRLASLRHGGQRQPLLRCPLLPAALLTKAGRPKSVPAANGSGPLLGELPR